MCDCELIIYYSSSVNIFFYLCSYTKELADACKCLICSTEIDLYYLININILSITKKHVFSTAHLILIRKMNVANCC